MRLSKHVCKDVPGSRKRKRTLGAKSEIFFHLFILPSESKQTHTKLIQNYPYTTSGEPTERSDYVTVHVGASNHYNHTTHSTHVAGWGNWKTLGYSSLGESSDIG